MTMTLHLTPESEVADSWNIPVEKFAALRQKHKWDHVRLDRFRVLYTDAQLEAIVRSRTVAGMATTNGRTPRPARVVKR